jgi:hypothetical protein
VIISQFLIVRKTDNSWCRHFSSEMALTETIGRIMRTLRNCTMGNGRFAYSFRMMGQHPFGCDLAVFFFYFYFMFLPFWRPLSFKAVHSAVMVVVVDLSRGHEINRNQQ